MSLLSFCFFISICNVILPFFLHLFDISDSHLVDWFGSGDLVSLVWLYLFRIAFRLSHEDPPKQLFNVFGWQILMQNLTSEKC